MVATANGGLPVAAPATVGMSAKRLETIDRVVERGIKAGGFPGAAVVVGRKGAAVWEKGFGRIDWDVEQPRRRRPRHDLRSRLAHQGRRHHHRHHDPVRRGAHQARRPVSRSTSPSSPAAARTRSPFASCSSTARACPPDRDLWRIAHSPAEARAGGARARRSSASPASATMYSDLGADHARLHGRARDAASGSTSSSHERVFEPLGMTNTFFRPADSLQVRIAPTEVTPPRGYPLQRRGARRERLRAGRRRRTRRAVQHRDRSLDLRADDAERRRVQRRRAS